MAAFLDRALEKLQTLNSIDAQQLGQIIPQIRQEYNRLLEVFNSIKEGVLVSDQSHNLILYNRPAQQFISIGRSKEPGEKMWNCLSDPQVAKYAKEALLNSEGSTQRQFTLSSGGSSHTYECIILPLVRQGSIVGNILRVEEITERLKREAQLYNAEKLISLSTLTANVAHEIKNPLGSIAIYIQLIQKALVKPTIDRALIAKNIEVINEEITRLNSVIVNFLYALRPMQLQRKELDINLLIQELVQFYTPEFNQRNIQVKMKLNQKLPTMDADNHYIKEALHNIVKNAIDAMPQGGTVTFTTTVAEGKIALAVADNGLGMNSETIRRIFEPYFTTKARGSGIGLTQVYKIIQEHGGDIQMSSQEGQGTTCRIYFPFSSSARKVLSEHN